MPSPHERKRSSSDPRIVRTRANLRQALISLLSEHRLDEITIADINTRADVSNATFFRHYSDKMALFQAVFEDMINTVSDRIQPALLSGDHMKGARGICEHVAAHPQIYRVLFSGGAAEKMREVLLTKAREIERKGRAVGDHPQVMPLPLVSSFSVTAILAIIGWWLDEIEDVPIDRAASLISDLVFKPLTDLTQRYEAEGWPQ